MKKIVFTGGGTAGHIIPNVAIFEKLKNDYEIYYIGGSGMEKDIICQYKYVKYYTIPTIKLERRFTLNNLKIPFVLIKSIKECKKILDEIKPNILFSKGGYVSVPVVIAAHKLNITIIGHESDMTLGLANKIILKYCKYMCFSFPNSKSKKYTNKCIHTYSPIRSNLTNGKPYNITKLFDYDNSLPTLTIMGGSMGAKAINACVEKSLDRLSPYFNIIHLTGKNNKINKTIKHYYQMEYCNNIEDVFATTDIVVSRAGSNAIWEFAYLNIPMLLIPLPKGASRGDQILNALYFENCKIAKVLYQEDLTKDTLVNNIISLKENSRFYINNMKNLKITNGVDNIIDIIKKNIK